MELTELTQARLIGLAVVLAIVGGILLSRWTERRRRARFAALGRALGAGEIAEADLHSSFTATIAERKVVVRHRHIGSHSQGGAKGWRVVTEVPLAGVSELHSAEIRPRRRGRFVDARDAGFAEHFVIRDFGMPLRDGWLGQRMRGAIGHFYALEAPLGALSIEEGRLVHRAIAPLQRFDGALLRELAERQVAVAEALERAL